MEFLKNMKNAFRNLPRRGQHNFAKILCLGVGLVVGSVLIAEVYFEQSYDTFIPHGERTYLVNEQVVRDGEYKEYPQTSGAIAPGIKEYAPQVEAATRFSPLSEDCECETVDKNTVKTNVCMADSNFFDVVPRPILQGNAKEVLSRPLYCMVNRKTAEKLGGNVVGKKLKLKDMNNVEITIGGVYEDIPLNSSMSSLRILLSLSTLRNYGSFDGSKNWIGNDRYSSLIRLAPGCKINEIKSQVEKMRQDHIIKELKGSGVDINYTFTQITKVFTSNPQVKRMSWIMSLLAFVLITSSVMNYLLIVVGNMVSRSKEMAIRKCFGAGSGRIYSVIFSEAFVHLLLSVAVSALLIFVCHGSIERLLSAPLSVLFFNKGAWIMVAVCLLILFVAGFVPGMLYSAIPVTKAFRGYNESRRRWKLTLLAVQIAAAGFLFSLLFIVNKQYQMMVNNDLGYSYDNLAVADLRSLKMEEMPKAIAELKKISEVEDVSSADILPISELSGNNIYLPGDHRELMNAADLYGVHDGFLKLMNMKIVQGRNFTEQTDSLNEIMVSRSFVDKMKLLAHWDDNAVGRDIVVSEHSINGKTFKICGVFDNIKLGNFVNADTRPAMIFYSKHVNVNLLIKFHSLTSDAMQKVRKTLAQLYPDSNIPLVTYKSQVVSLYETQNHFREGILAGGIVILVVALIGLVGYTNDEVVRRRKEIAIRKVNGAGITSVLKLFFNDILRITLPSLVVGGVAAFYISHKWLEQFSEKTSQGLYIYLLSSLMVLGIMLVIVYLNCYKIANSNPVDYLKDE